MPALVLSITTSFMFFIFEPITMFATNPNDFWFDLYDILPSLLLTFLLISLGAFTVLAVCYILCKHLFKKVNLYYIFVAICFCIFFITYIQGNFLSGSLPGINYEVFNWRLYKSESIISIGLWLIAFLSLIVALVNLKPAKLFSFIPFLTAAVFLMLGTSLVSTLLTTKALEDKPVSIATYKNFNLASKNQNLFIFLVDAVDSRSFDNLLKNNKDYQETFKDFSYYQDTLSSYPYTRDCLPYLFNPTFNKNEIQFTDYSRKTFAESELFDSLKEDNYNMNYFDDIIFMDSPTVAKFENMIDRLGVKPKELIKEIIRYDLYKYLPYPLKGKIHIEKLSFSKVKDPGNERQYIWNDIENYQIFENEDIEVTEDKVFHFIHLEGAHVWFNIDENLQPSKDGNYTQKQIASFKLAQSYIKRLKEAGVYDNSAIVVLADHGYRDGVWEYDYILDRFNPILYIKGVGEHHDSMVRSDKPIEASDLANAFNDLRLKKKSTELFQNISSPRKRTLVYYVWSKESHMVEYETEGKAWESDKMKETGNVYDLK